MCLSWCKICSHCNAFAYNKQNEGGIRENQINIGLARVFFGGRG